MQNVHNDFLHGNLDVAQKKADQARVAFASNSPDWSLQFLLQEAEIRTYQGRRPEVISLLNCGNSSYPITGDAAIKRYLLCGQAHARLGQMQLADQELERAQDLSDGTKSRLAGELLRSEAQVQVYRNEQAKAEELFRASLQIAKQQNDSYLEASDLLNLGMAAVDLQHYDEALTLLKESSDKAYSIQARTVSEAALGDAGLAYLNLGDSEKALANFQQAQQEAIAIGTTSSQVDWLWDIGSSYYLLGNLEQATSYYRQALSLARSIDNSEEIAGIAANLGRLLYDESQFSAAKTESDEAMGAARKAGDQPLQAQALFLQAKLATRLADGKNAEQLLIQVLQQSEGIPSQKLEVESELAKLYIGRHQPKQADMWFRKSIETFESDRAAIRDEELRLPFFANGEIVYRQYANFLIDSGEPVKALHLLDEGRARTLSEGLGQTQSKANSGKSDALNEQSVARKLNATILFYSLGPEKSYLWAVDSQRTRLFVLPKASELEARIAAYSNTILRSGDPLRVQDENARYLYDTLVGPAIAMVPRGSKVVLITDGALNSLNFESLLTPEADGPHYWIEDVTLVNASSIRLLSASNSETRDEAKSKSLLLIGDPVPENKDFARLPNAPAEISTIERHFQPDERTTLTKAEAIPSAYAANRPERFSYIHFVTHGTASRLSPLDSAVVLSAAPGQPDSYKLYARDIVHQPLHAKLVTISACNGSGVRDYAGEGLVGLSWAFLRAGSHNVIGALWEVNDASTPLLMDRLYSEIDAGKSPAAALREAKLSLIHSTGVYRKPLYWAAFQLYAGS